MCLRWKPGKAIGYKRIPRKTFRAFQEKIMKNIWGKIRCAKCKNNKASI